MTLGVHVPNSRVAYCVATSDVILQAPCSHVGVINSNQTLQHAAGGPRSLDDQSTPVPHPLYRVHRRRRASKSAGAYRATVTTIVWRRVIARGLVGRRPVPSIDARSHRHTSPYDRVPWRVYLVTPPYHDRPCRARLGVGTIISAATAVECWQSSTDLVNWPYQCDNLW